MRSLPSGLRRFLLILGVVIVVLLALPYLLTPLYRFGHPVSTPMMWRYLTGSRVQRIYVPIGRMAPSLPLTVIIAEDGTFCRNRGVDFSAIREALHQADEDFQEARGIPSARERFQIICRCAPRDSLAARRIRS